MKRIAGKKAILFAAVLTLLCGCGKAAALTSDEVAFSNGLLDATSYNEKGKLYFDENWMAKFVDAKSGEEIYVCNRPNCPHVHNARNPECYADLNVPVLTGFIYGDYIYYLYTDMEADIPSLALGREDFGGQNREVVAKINNAQLVLMISVKDGVLAFNYINQIDFSDPSNPVDLEEDENHIAAIDLETFETTTFAIDGYCNGIRAGKDSIWYGRYLVDGQSFICNNKMDDEISLPAVQQSAMGGSYYIGCTETGYFIYDLDNKQKVENNICAREGQMTCSAYGYGNRIYYTMYNMDSGDYSRYIYDIDKKESQEYGKGMIMYTALADNRLYYMEAPEDSNGANFITLDK